MSNNAQIKAEAIEIINTIFTKILKNLNLQEQVVPNQPELYKHQLFNLELYREALIGEVNAGRCEHPLRAAVALEKLHSSTSDAEFTTNLSKFKHDSQHSGLYPTTRRLGALVAHSLLAAGSIALTILVSGWFAVLAGPVLWTYMYKTIPHACEGYKDVYDAKEKSKEVCNFYATFRRPPKPSAPHASPPPYALPVANKV